MYRELYEMKGQPFVADMHFFHKAIAPVVWPATKAEIIAEVGDRVVKTGWDSQATVKELVDPILLNRFENAHEFYCAFFASLYKAYC